MSEFYHDLITEKSFKTLQDLRRGFNFILIGGWAVYLYTKALKSKDIDIILDYEELEKIKQKINISKNERLKKYEAKIDEVDVDIYLPYFSNIGMPVEEIKNYCESLEGFLVPIPEILIILKVYTYKQREGTTKGKKDIIDIFSLIKRGEINWQTYRELIKKYKYREIARDFKKIISSQSAIPELNLLNHQISRLKKKVLREL